MHITYVHMIESCDKAVLAKDSCTLKSKFCLHLGWSIRLFWVCDDLVKFEIRRAVRSFGCELQEEAEEGGH